MHLDNSMDRKIAAFHIHLAGPALTWFQSLDTDTQTNWHSLEEAFNRQYIKKHGLDPSTIAASHAFSRIKLLDGQALEDYHSLILKQGTCLEKNERDMLLQFIDGLPPSLAFFVRAGMCTTLQSALQAAQAGDAAGYRSSCPVFQNSHSVSAARPARTSIENDIRVLQAQLENLTAKLTSQPALPQPQFICYRCGGPGHF